MTAREQRSPSRGARIVAVTLIGLLGLFVLAQASSSGTSAVVSVRDEAPVDPDTLAAPGTPPAADLAALLNGLSLGNEFDGWKVLNFTPTRNKLVWIEFGKDKTYFSVSIGVKGSGKPPPPIQTELYEVGYGMVRPKGAMIPQDVPTRMVEQIASRIRMREKEVARPGVF